MIFLEQPVFHPQTITTTTTTAAAAAAAAAATAAAAAAAVLLLLLLLLLLLFPNCRYNDCLSLTYVTNKSKILKLCYKYYKTFKIYIKVLIISSHNNSNKENAMSVFHHFCPGLPVLLSY